MTTAAARTIYFIILLVAVDLVLPAIFNDTLLMNNTIETRRAKKKEKKVRSTSSSSNAKKSDSSGSSVNSLDMTTDSSSSSDNSTKIAGLPKSSAERRGWRKWHRKCTPCPEDRKLKWRDPRIKWICGGYQRARRSFKSLCMMHYRNCQDGTMFIKVGDYRCQNDSERAGWKMGDHFFYEYKVKLRDDTTDSKSSDSDDTEYKSYDSK